MLDGFLFLFCIYGFEKLLIVTQFGRPLTVS